MVHNGVQVTCSRSEPPAVTELKIRQVRLDFDVLAFVETIHRHLGLLFGIRRGEVHFAALADDPGKTECIVRLGHIWREKVIGNFTQPDRLAGQAETRKDGPVPADPPTTADPGHKHVLPAQATAVFTTQAGRQVVAAAIGGWTAKQIVQ